MQQIITQYSDIIVQIIAVIATIGVAILSYFLKKKSDRIKTIESLLSERKYKAYADAINMFYSMLKDTKTNKTFNFEKNLDKMISVKRDIFMYGSDSVFNKFNRWLVCSSNGDDPQMMINNLLEFMLEIRLDLSNRTSKIKKKDILLSLTQNKAEVDKIIK